jgi:glycosyltransferase involved in cell wall biosynthesis
LALSRFSVSWIAMKLLHIIDTLSPVTGGPPEAVRQLVSAYVTIGGDVEIVTLDNSAEAFLRDVPCRLHTLNQTSLGRFAFSPRLWTWLRENASRFDGMVMNGIWSFPGVALRHAALRAKIPYGIFVHGALDPWFNRQYPLKHLKKKIYWPVQHAVLRDASAVFFTSEVERDLACSSFYSARWNSVVVPYGITDPTLNWSHPAPLIEEFYRALPGLRGRRFLLFLARIHEKKGCDLLVQAFAKLAPLVPDVDLVMAGPDQEGMQASLKDMAERLGIAGRVHWPGLIGGKVKWGALVACDAFILPSHQENFGISVVEALAVGRPVLISNQVNIWPEIQTHGVGLVDDDTYEGTERLLRRWFELPPPERDAMAARARPCFAARFEMNRTASMIREFFSSIKNDGKRVAQKA